jgi:hypothetical protein
MSYELVERCSTFMYFGLLGFWGEITFFVLNGVKKIVVERIKYTNTNKAN